MRRRGVAADIREVVIVVSAKDGRGAGVSLVDVGVRLGTER